MASTHRWSRRCARPASPLPPRSAPSTRRTRRWTPVSTSSWPAAARAAATVATRSPPCRCSKPCSTASIGPVLAAGGIATARGLAAVLAAGAVGAWVGTAFLGCPETMWSPARRSKVLAADLDSTIYTHVYDIAMQQPWPAQYGGRVVRNTFTETWHGREDELAADGSVRADLEAAADREDFDQFSVWAGQAAGLVTRRAQRRRRGQRLRRRRAAAAPVGRRVAAHANAEKHRWGCRPRCRSAPSSVFHRFRLSLRRRFPAVGQVPP